MPLRRDLALVVATLFAHFVAAPSAGAQSVVRFETTVGDFDMVLNPTNNPLLQGHVDNMLDYVEDGKYRRQLDQSRRREFRVADGRLLFAHQARADDDRKHAACGSVRNRRRCAGLDDYRSVEHGRHRLARIAGGAGGTNQDGGTSSFFVNLTSNTFLDADFTVFAAISDMTTINNIMALMQTDLTALPDFGAGAGNLGFSDVPLEDKAFKSSSAVPIRFPTRWPSPEHGRRRNAMAASLAGGGQRQLVHPHRSGRRSSPSRRQRCCLLLPASRHPPPSPLIVRLRQHRLRHRSGDVLELVHRRIEVDRANIVAVGIARSTTPKLKSTVGTP